MNATQVDAFNQTLRQTFTQWLNETRDAADPWAPMVHEHFSQDIQHNGNAQLLERVCASAGQALGPMFSVLVLLAFQALPWG